MKLLARLFQGPGLLGRRHANLTHPSPKLAARPDTLPDTRTSVHPSTRPHPHRMLAGLVVLLLAQAPAWAAQRLALIIGNAAYSEGRLANPVNDAQLMDRTLRDLGFQVERLENADFRRMQRAVREFGTRAQGADVALIYYAGHGMQQDNENWLLPIGAQIDKPADVPAEAVAASTLLRQLEDARPRMALVVLDACRNNPFASRTRSQSRGLTRMEAPSGSIVAYAAQPGAVADDGSGRNGLYTRHLAHYLKQPGLDIKQVFEETALAVEKESGGKQRPREDIGLRGRHYLAGPPRGGSGTAVATLEVERVAPAPAATAPAPVPPTAPAAIQSGQTIQDCAECPVMVALPAGSFEMGSPASEPGRNASEGPVRRVQIQAFLMGKHEVTQGQWRALMGSNPSQFKDCGDDCPVEQVSWNDAQAYIAKLNTKTGQRYRLPSEAEWEYAARAGTQTPFHTGQTLSTEQANFNGNSTYNGSARGVYRQKTVKVGSFGANAFGLHDMHGNVWEWVHDVALVDYEHASIDGSARALDGDYLKRVLRGGSWSDYSGGLRSALRFWVAPESRSSGIGFRLARPL